MGAYFILLRIDLHLIEICLKRNECIQVFNEGIGVLKIYESPVSLAVVHLFHIGHGTLTLGLFLFCIESKVGTVLKQPGVKSIIGIIGAGTCNCSQYASR